MSPHARGLLIVALGVVILSPDSATIRLVSLDPWSVAVWRSLGAAATFLILAWLRHRRDFWGYVRSFGRLGFVLVPAMALGQISFVAGVSFTAPAIALVLVGATPFFTALFAWVLIGERSSVFTLMLIALGFVGVGITLIGGEGQAEVTWFGNMFAVLIPVSLALAFTMIRKTQAPDIWLLFGLSHALAACVVASLNPIQIPQASQDIALLAVNGLVISSLAMALITLGLRYLPAAEVSLLMTGETILGPLLVWWWIGIAPGWNAWLGGALVVLALVVHSVWRLRRAP